MQLTCIYNISGGFVSLTVHLAASTTFQKSEIATASDVSRGDSDYNAQQQPNSTVSVSPGHAVPPEPPDSQLQTNETSPNTEDPSSEYIKPVWSNYRLIINEVSPLNDVNNISFIEHRRVCEAKAREPTSSSTNNFAEIVLLSGQEVHQVMFASFHGKELQPISENVAGKLRPVVTNYFMLGNNVPSPQMTFSDSNV